MHDAEFAGQASAIASQIPDLAPDERIPAACRGSGNPAMLSWLAEGLSVDPASLVVDVGAGIGGPAAWLTERYGCTVVAVEPAEPACRAAKELFGLASVCSAAERLPFADATFDAALLLGVCSVVDDPAAVLAEARRVARRLALSDYAAAGPTPVLAGGSTFRPSAAVEEAVRSAGWIIDQTSDAVPPTPSTWSAAAESIEVDEEAGEAEVATAIADGRIVPFMMVALTDGTLR